MSALNVVLFTFLLVLAYLVTPTLLVWGWARWIKPRPRLWTISLALSFGSANRSRIRIGVSVGSSIRQDAAV